MPWARVSHLGAPPPPAGPSGLRVLVDACRLRKLLTDESRLAALDDQLQDESAEFWLETIARLVSRAQGALGATIRGDMRRVLLVALGSGASDLGRRLPSCLG